MHTTLAPRTVLALAGLAWTLLVAAVACRLEAESRAPAPPAGAAEDAGGGPEPSAACRRYGWVRDLPALDDEQETFKVPAPKAAYPAKYLQTDWPPVYDQMRAGSCVGNSVAGVAHWLEIKANLPPPTTPSRLFAYYNARRYEGTTGQDAGASIKDGVRGVAKYGICNEDVWPYSDSPAAVTRRPSAEAYSAAEPHRFTVYGKIPDDGRQAAIKHAISSDAPVVYGFTVYQSFETNVGKNGKVPMPRRGERVLGGHANVLIGYDDHAIASDGKPGEYVSRNSWGASFGDHGLVRFPYRYLDSPSLAADFWWVQAMSE